MCDNCKKWWHIACHVPKPNIKAKFQCASCSQPCEDNVANVAADGNRMACLLELWNDSDEEEDAKADDTSDSKATSGSSVLLDDDSADDMFQ
ncbi:hypothetical protein CYMTET_56143 [Cymbomonas tetramitiformis]|uniref:Uncharacterized protein n=1 Tax=Cymbomonas tetramitiformis TaxID=36881 RepID=A0AAE0BBV9_9CHLO|nr:hypothetical protein CYMTET_56143 [Cymbomonas tetramitiformis]